jgi:hypothetical protein
MDYVHIPTGVKVTVADGKTLPAGLYKPVEQPKKRAPRKRAAKNEA